MKKNKKDILILATIFLSSILFSGCSTTNNDIDKDMNLSTSSAYITHESNAQLVDINDNKNVIKATVDRVVDGDTVEIILPNNQEVDTRLLLIDTPETKHPKLGVQKFGEEASEFAKEVLNPGDIVYFELDKGSKTDKYGRYLGYLWYECDVHNTLEMYNERVVEEGLARVGYIYDQTKHLDALLSTEDLAKTNNLNIWSIDGYVTEKGYNMDVIDNHSDSEVTDSDNTSNSSSMVYANGGSSSSNVYHKSPNAHGMKDSIKMTMFKANIEGYEPCQSCFK